MTADCVIQNGKLVIPKQGIFKADIAVAGEKIIQIGREIPDGKRVIDAAGKYIFPGCVDMHTHYGHCNEFYNEMETESKCLASLGVTTSVILLDRCIKNMEGWKEKITDTTLFEQPMENVPGFIHRMWRASYKKIFPEVIEKSEKYSSNDFTFHLAMVNTDQVEEIPYYYQELGIASFKCWTGLYRSVALTPPELWVFYNTCKAAGVLPYVNTVNFEIQEQLTRETERRAKTDKSLTGPALVKASRGASIIETHDLQTALWMAKEVGTPELMIAHVASGEAVRLLRLYKKEYGLNVAGEACGVWLDLFWPDVGEKLGYMATCIIPQINDKADVDVLWDGIETDDITCFFFSHFSVFAYDLPPQHGQNGPAVERPAFPGIKRGCCFQFLFFYDVGTAHIHDHKVGIRTDGNRSFFRIQAHGLGRIKGADFRNPDRRKTSLHSRM